MCKLAERKAQEEQLDEDPVAILREARVDAEQARAEAEQARAEAEQVRAKAQRIATLESQNEQLRESLAEAQSARLVLSEQQENRPATSKKRAKGRKK